MKEYQLTFAEWLMARYFSGIDRVFYEFNMEPLLGKFVSEITIRGGEKWDGVQDIGLGVNSNSV